MTMLRKIIFYASLTCAALTAIVGLELLFLADTLIIPNLKIYIFLTIMTIVLLLGLIVITGKSSATINTGFLEKLDGIQRLLLDMRDGTKFFYQEKRRDERVKTRDRIIAKLAGNQSLEPIDTLDISYGGMLLKTRRKFTAGETAEFELYLPTYTQPIHVKSKCVWIDAIKESLYIYAGIEFLAIEPVAKKKLVEAIDLLAKLPHAAAA